MTLYQELSERGLIFQETSAEIGQALEKPMTFYCGFDPTGDSLHVGHMLPLLTLRRMQAYGHRPIVLLGGATGLIGDPSGKSQERVLLGPDDIRSNVESIRKNVEKIIDFSGENGAILVNNMDWMEGYSFIHFLRDIGKHFSVNAMLAKDSVKARIENREQGISYTEFSYTLLQSYDFHYLYKKHGCRLQVGASDQWGNITSGIDLIRRLQGDVQDKESCYGMTFPLITKADGTKFGKSEGGNVWLSADKTSPYQFYQFFLNLTDAEALKLLRFFSLKPLTEIKEIEQRFQAEPHLREAQKCLAAELTTLLHGEAECAKADQASRALFSGDFSQLDKGTLLEVFKEAPSYEQQSNSQETIIDLLVSTGLCTSKGNARKDLAAGAVYINNAKWSDETASLDALPRLMDDLLILRRGKKNHCLVRLFS